MARMLKRNIWNLIENLLDFEWEKFISLLLKILPYKN